MERVAFEQLVAEGFGAIPKNFREGIKNTVFIVEDEPSEEVRREENLLAGETLLGHYFGVPLSERGDSYGIGAVVPDIITLYQKPIEEEAANLLITKHRVFSNFEEAVRKVVADTVWHEIAHHFGFDEREVRRREIKQHSDR